MAGRSPGPGCPLVGELGTVLRLDARRSTILIAVPMLALLGTGCAWTGLLPGVAYWESSVAAIAGSVRGMGPAAAAISAWAAIRERRSAYIRTLSSRSPAVGPMLDLLLLTVVTLLAYCLVVLLIAGATLFQGGVGEADPLALPAGAAALALHVVVGYLAGRLASARRSVPAVPVAAAVGLAVAGWALLRPGGTWPSLLPPAVQAPVGLFSALRPGLTSDQLLWSLSLAVGVTLAYVWTLSRRPTLLIPVASVLVVAAVCTVRLQSYGGTAISTDLPNGYACRQWPLTVCVHPALAAALPSVEAAVTPLALRLAGTPGAFRKVQQLPDDVPAEVRAGTAHVHLPDLAGGYERRLARELVAALAPCAATPAAAYAAMVDGWLLDEHLPRAALGWGSWDEDRRHRWLRAHYARYHACALGPQDFEDFPAG